MTRAFDNLLAEARRAHETHPALSDFCPFPTDLRPVDLEPFHVPAADLMYADERLASPDVDPLARAFLDAGPDARWRETYKGTDIGDDFMARFGCYCLIGPGGAWTSGQMHGYVVYMPPRLHYPWHEHPAEELYLVLAGEARFLREGEAPERLVAGAVSFHASSQPHAMETGESSVMAYVLWRNHFDTPPKLTRRPVAGAPTP